MSTLMSATDPAPTSTPPAPAPSVDELNTAQQRLTAAVTELLQPVRIDLARDAAEDLDDELDQAHADELKALRARHADHLERHNRSGRSESLRGRDVAGMRRTLALIIESERRHRAAAAARAARQTERPSLLDQLTDAVMSRQGHGGGAAGVHRWIYAVDAAQLLADIDRTVRPIPARQAPYRPLTPQPVHGRPPSPPRDLAPLIRSWAGLAGYWRTTRPAMLVYAADTAHRWTVQAREIIHPRQRMTAVGACPHCGHATAYVDDGAGEHVRRPALEIDVATGWARCINPGCHATWPPERLSFLARILEQQNAEPDHPDTGPSPRT